MEWLCHRYVFKCLKNYETVFQGVRATLHSHQQPMRVPVTPHPHQRLLFTFSYTTAWLVIVHYIFHFSSLMMNLFMRLLAIYFFSRQVSGQTCCPFLQFFWIIEFWQFLIYTGYTSGTSFANIFSVCSLPFPFLNNVFWKIKALSFDEVWFISFFFF